MRSVPLPTLGLAALLGYTSTLVNAAEADRKHPIPPRGWNSYTGYSIAVTQEELH